MRRAASPRGSFVKLPFQPTAYCPLKLGQTTYYLNFAGATNMFLPQTHETPTSQIDRSIDWSASRVFENVFSRPGGIPSLSRLHKHVSSSTSICLEVVSTVVRARAPLRRGLAATEFEPATRRWYRIFTANREAMRTRTRQGIQAALHIVTRAEVISGLQRGNCSEISHSPLPCLPGPSRPDLRSCIVLST